MGIVSRTTASTSSNSTASQTHESHTVPGSVCHCVHHGYSSPPSPRSQPPLEEVGHALPRALALHLRLQPAEPDHRAAPDEGQVRGGPQEPGEWDWQPSRAAPDSNIWIVIMIILSL